jgi:hypothetical protein
MLSDAELDSLAKSLLEDVVAELANWEAEEGRKPFYCISTDEADNLVLTYGGHSSEGYGTFACDYTPIDAIKSIIRNCEKLSDEFPIQAKIRETGETKTVTLAELEIENKAGLVDTIAGTASLYLLAHLTARMGEAIQEAIRDSDLMAQSVIGASIGTIFNKLGIGGTSDAVDEIEIAAQRVAKTKRDLLRGHLKEMPHMVVQRGRGRKPKSAAEREHERQEYSARLEGVYRARRLKEGKQPTKVSVAGELGEGGVNPKKGSDTRLNAFNLKLARLGINYDEIVNKVEDELLHNNS